ncbi:helix-turn-helix transcriptional regulator [Enterococcus faecium]|uniref:helix-turn-helix domain-containing protein n=1 Tax=Enterococcus TaxID=1350 RepID=UPI000A32F159|nr:MULTISPECIES: helix-turn-helix transcriptional regulator [Enterococcus]EGP5030316.1 helix-turn-helix transcriptional regulator [Enterococcus faecium]EKY7854592.1 helix-turn-helix transcriptional regulator [Enterococcus faecium]EKY7909008.1 helix-turn-helix transcriptional regulator [Enterococcus faecium]EKZ1858819.1 helix-turn-helix transcriptional regulator [Enterococcus faecium]EME7212906.1 helix-turn-helix transcriptional regulator [Enterococcus faecium]
MITFERIKELAKKQGKSLNKVEEDLGYGKNVLYRLKNSNPSTERLQEIADYFNVSVDYLLGREEKETPKHVDLSEDDTVFSFDGKEISKETMRKAIAIAKALEENE